MTVDWFFSKELSPSNILVDKFADSKFEIDRWTSFAREIVQNSLDAQDDPNSPVKIVFDLNKSLSLKDIPGGDRTLQILNRCYLAARNKQTQGAYKKGIEVLSKDKVYCLKISDYNTKGVETGRDCAWGALVYDEGVSVKQRPGSAGSHGVGKKVPFIISSCNTVFYATKNKTENDGIIVSDCLFEGKTMLINWNDVDETRRSPNGWYGKIKIDSIGTPVDVIPLMNDDLSTVHPYFKRVDSFGTDVIIIGVNAYDNEETIKKSIINAIMDNFFVALKRGTLQVNVFGESITKDSFNSVFSRWYEPLKKTNNTLKDCLEAYSCSPAVLPISDASGEILGQVTIYFKLGNSLNKKYYSIVRSHGMKIKENRINSADQPYTAVVVTDGDILNTLLSNLENAAHDDFIVKDENIDIDQRSIDAYESLRNQISQFILENTKIDDGESQNIQGLNSIISIPGTYATIKERLNGKPRIRKNTIKRNSESGEKSNSFDKGTGLDGEGKKKKKNGDLGHKPNKNGGKAKAILYEDYAIDPFVVSNSDGLVLSFSVLDNIKYATIKLSSINSEDKADDSLNDIITKVVYNHKTFKPTNGSVVGLTFKANEQVFIRVYLKRRVVYQIKAELYYSEDNDE